MSHNNLTKELISRTNHISFYKYIGVLPNPDSLFVRHGKSYQTYRDLRNDPHLWACLQSRKSGTLARGWRISRGEASESVFDFIRLCFGNIDMQQLIRQMLEAVFMGFQAFEIIWQPQYWQGSTIYSVKEVSARPQEYFCFDTKGRLQLQTATGQQSRAIPPNKVLLLQHEADYENPYGQPLLGKCYWACTFKSTAMRF